MDLILYVFFLLEHEEADCLKYLMNDHDKQDEIHKELVVLPTAY